MAKFVTEADVRVLDVETYVCPYLELDFATEVDGFPLGNVVAKMTDAAQRWAEGYLGMAIGLKTVRICFNAWPQDSAVKLPLSGVIAYDTMEYMASGENGNYVEVSGWTGQAVPGIVSDTISFFPTVPGDEDDLLDIFKQGRPEKYKLSYEAGTAVLANVDPRIVQAMLLKIKHWYVNRADSALTTDDSHDIRTATELLDQVLREIQS